MSIRNMLDNILNEAAGSRNADASNAAPAEKIEKDITKEGGGFDKSTARPADKKGELAAKEGTKIDDPSGKITMGKGTEVQGNTDTSKGMGESVSRTVADSLSSLVEFKIDMAGIKSLCEEQELSEEVSTKMVEIFEVAVNDIVKSKLSNICESADTIIAEAIDAELVVLEEQIDKYLSYVVTEWAEDNRIAIETGARTEIAESFMENLKGLLEDHYVELPEDKADLYEMAVVKGEEIYTKLQEAEEREFQLQEEIATLQKSAIVESVVSGMTDLQASKVRALSEDVAFTTEGEFKSKLSTLAEGYVKTKKSTDAAITEDVGSLITEQETTGAYVDPAVQAAVNAISKFRR